MIDVQDLTKRYRHAIAVDGLSFRAEPGKVTGFLGPNGAGKSTTMRVLLGIERPTIGSALVGGRPVTTLAEPLRTIGALLDPGAVHSGRTAAAHLRVAAASNGLPGRRVDEVLEQVGLTDVAARRIRTFSLGMRQRLGIAAALLGDPDVLVFDEPMNGLDVDGVRWIRGLLRGLADRGRTVLISSHLLSEVQATADHLVVIGRGRLLAQMPTRELIDGLGGRQVAASTSAPDRLTGALRERHIAVARVDGDTVYAAGTTTREVGAAAQRHGIPLSHLADVERSLEEAYLELTGDSLEHRSTPDTAATR